MKYSSVQLTDLPDEILMIIFRKIHNIELLYSLMDLDPRIDAILTESIFTNRLPLLRFISRRLVNRRSTMPYYVYPLLAPTLDRFCERILPKINQKIRWLELESTSIERVLHVTYYSNLCGVAMYNISTDEAFQVFSSKTFHFI